MFTPFAFVKSAAAAPPPAFDFVLAYTSSFVAYSVARKLKSDYAGSAFRVRKASDGTQQDIGFVDNILDTASLASFCGGSNGHIVTWYDQSGNGINQSGNGTGVGPLIWNGSAVITGSSGIPACSFNGTDQYFAQTTAFTSNKVAEVFSVCTIDAYTNQGTFWCTPDNGYGYGCYEAGSGNVSIVVSDGTRLGQQSTANGNIVLVDVLYNVGAGTNNSFLWIDGSQTNFTLDNPASPYNTSFLAASFTKTNIGRAPFGGSFYTNGRMSEWILYNNVDTQRTNIRTNFDNFYNTY